MKKKQERPERHGHEAQLPDKKRRGGSLAPPAEDRACLDAGEHSEPDLQTRVRGHTGQARQDSRVSCSGKAEI